MRTNRKMQFPWHQLGIWRALRGLVAIGALAILQLPVQGQYTWTNVAGRTRGSGYEDATGVAARLRSPTGIVMTVSGDAYFSDTDNHVIRRVTPEGVVSTFVGTPMISGNINGTGLAARFNAPTGLALDGAGNLYVADTGNHTIRKVTPAGVVSTLAGSSSGYADGVGSAASFASPKALAWSDNGKLYVIDVSYAVRVIQVADATVSTVAGTNTSGYLDAVGTAARFAAMNGVVVLADGSLRVTDQGNHCIRAIAADGTVTTVAGLAGSSGTADGMGGAGGPARFNRPSALAVDPAGNLLIGNLGSGTIRRLTPTGLVTTISGRAGVFGDQNGDLSEATYRTPAGIAYAADGSLWIADRDSDQIRRLGPAGEVTTLAGSSSEGSDDGQGEQARFFQPDGIALDAAGFLYVSDRGNNTIRKISPDGTVTTLAGTAGQSGYVDATGSAARFNYPRGLCVDPQGNVIVSERAGSHLRKITPAGVVSTLAPLFNAVDVVQNNDGNFFAVAMDYELYRITPGGVVTTAAGTWSGNDAETVPLMHKMTTPIALAANGAGKVFFLDYSNSSLKVLNPGVSVRRICGGTAGYADGWGTGKLSYPVGVAADANGTCFVADSGNYCIRKVTRQGLVSTIGGTDHVSGNGIGVGSAAKFYHPTSLVVAPDGTIYVANKLANNIVKGVLTGPEIEVHQASATVPTTYIDSHERRRFGVVGTGKTETMRFTILNRGAANLAGIKVTLDGADAADFALVSLPLDRLGGGSASDFVVRFAPSAAGTKTAAIHIASTDEDEGVFDIDLIGTAVVTPAPGVLYWRNWAGIPGTSGSLCEHADESKFTGPRQLAVGPNGDLFVADSTNHTIMKISVNGQVSLVAGFAGEGYSSNGKREEARFSTPTGVACDGTGVLYVTETSMIRRISADGTTTTLATGLAVPGGVVWDSSSASLIVANTNNHTMVRVSTAGVVTPLAGTSNSSGSNDGTGTTAKFKSPRAVAVDAAGIVFVADSGNHTIRRIATNGAVTTLAGAAGIIGSADGHGGAARFNNPSAIALDSAGNLWIADTGNHLIRRLDPAGNVTTMSGAAGSTGNGTGLGTAARFNAPAGIAVSRNGRVYVANKGTFNIVESTALGGDIAVDLVDGGTLVADAGIPMAATLDTPTTVRFRIRNLGSAPLASVSASLTGADDFSLTELPTAVIEPGAESFLEVEFHPTSAGNHAAVLAIASDDPDQNPFVIHFNVTVDPPDEGGVGANAPQLTLLPDGRIEMEFQGVPGRTYQILRSKDLTTWSLLATVIAGPAGALNFIDESPPQPNGFYRLSPL